jgi:hypothetical protein
LHYSKITRQFLLAYRSWVEASAGGLLVPEGLYNPVAKYFGTWALWNTNMNSTVKKIVNFIDEGLFPSCISLSFDGFGSISWHYIWVLSALSHFFSDFQHLDVSITDETLLVEMRIWCIKIGIVLVLHWWGLQGLI